MLLCDYTNDGNDYIFGWCDYPNGDKCEPCLLRQAEGFFELILPDSGQRHMEESPSFDSHTIPGAVHVRDALSKDLYCVIDARFSSISFDTDRNYGSMRLRTDCVIKCDSYDEDMGYSNVASLGSTSPDLTKWFGLRTSGLNQGFDKEMAALAETYGGEIEQADNRFIGADEGLNLGLSISRNLSARCGMAPSVDFGGRVWFESFAPTPKLLNDHFECHLKLTALLSIICWRNISFERMRVEYGPHEGDGVDGSMDTFPINPLISTRFDPWEPPRTNKPYLIAFDDIGESGLGAWFSLMSNYSIPLRQISYIAKMHNNLTLENQVTLFGIAFEELGAAILGSRSKRRTTCECIKGLLGDSFADCEKSSLLFDEALPQVIANTYNSIKHPKEQRGGRPREEWLLPGHLLNVVYACREIALVWIASRLGCREKVISKLGLEQQFSQALKECAAYAAELS